MIVVLEAKAQPGPGGEVRHFAERRDHRRPALAGPPFGVSGEDPHLRRAERFGDLDPLLTFGDLALTPGGGGAAEVVVDADPDDGEARSAAVRRSTWR